MVPDYYHPRELSITFIAMKLIDRGYKCCKGPIGELEKPELAIRFSDTHGSQLPSQTFRVASLSRPTLHARSAPEKVSGSHRTIARLET